MEPIGITGFAGSGKSIIAKHLESKGYTRHNFKDGLIADIKMRFPELLQELAEMYCITVGTLFTQKPPLMRALMQNYGTNVCRANDPNHWVDIWSDNLPDEPVVTDDVRFINEANSIRERGGIIIRVVRTDITTGGDHVSETEQLQLVPDYTIEVGKGEIDLLKAKVDEIL